MTQGDTLDGDTMMQFLPLLLLLHAGTCLIQLSNGFSVTHLYVRPQLRAIKSQARALKTRRARPTNLRGALFATSDEFSSSDDAAEDDTSSDQDVTEEEEEEEATTDADEKQATDSASDEKQVTDSASDDEPTTWRGRMKKLWWKNDDANLTTRQRLAKMGLAAVLSYGWVSNVSYAVCISFAWYGFSKKTGLSPLAPDQWKPFLAVYAGFFVFNNVIRPFRLGLSIAISQYFDQVVAWVQEKTKFNKSISIALVVFLFNIVGTISLMCLGITLASLAAGVPIFPRKTVLGK